MNNRPENLGSYPFSIGVAVGTGVAAGVGSP
jgi:hypothetical protein